MIDPHDYELTNEEHEALLLKSEHAIAPPLSPAARAVLRAATDAYDEWDLRDSIAEALRTAAVYCTYDRIRLLAIADQLDTRGNP